MGYLRNCKCSTLVEYMIGNNSSEGVVPRLLQNTIGKTKYSVLVGIMNVP